MPLALYMVYLPLPWYLAAIGRAVEAALPEGMGASEEAREALNKSCAGDIDYYVRLLRSYV